MVSTRTHSRRIALLLAASVLGACAGWEYTRWNEPQLLSESGWHMQSGTPTERNQNNPKERVVVCPVSAKAVIGCLLMVRELYLDPLKWSTEFRQVPSR